MTAPTAVVVGMENNGLGVARALASHGVPVIGVTPPPATAACRTNASTIVFCESWTAEALIGTLMSLAERLDRKAPVIITKDEAVLWISEARGRLEAAYELNLPDPEVVSLLMNKKSFADRAASRAWPLPATWSVSGKDELMSVLGEVVFPCIVKPHMKNSLFRKSTASKAFVVRSAPDLIATYDMVSQWERDVILQEWIEGDDSRIAFCLTYHDREGRPRASFAGRKLRQWPIRCGNTAIAEPAPEAWREELTALTHEIWKDVGFRGLGSIEYKMRLRTNAPVIMEPTVGRTNLQNEIAVLNGVNIPAIAYCDMIRAGYHPPAPPRFPVKLIDGSAELKAAIAYWRRGELGVRQWIKDRSGAKRYFVLRANDLGPWLASVGLLARRALGAPFKLAARGFLLSRPGRGGGVRPR